MNIYKILDTLKSLEEGSMKSAEHHSSGPKFTGYWKGTDPRTPGQHMVGGSAEESWGGGTPPIQGPGVDDSASPIHNRELDLEEELMQEWDQFLKEYGMTTGGMGMADGHATADPAQQQKELQKTQQSLNKLQGAGVKTPMGTNQAAQSIVKTLNNPAANPTTGAGMDQTAKKVTGQLGQGMEELLSKGNPGQVQQVANTLKQIRAGQK